jgi:hypothetical protein
MGCNNNCVVTAQLKDRTTKALADDSGHVVPNLATTGYGNETDSAVLN